jgi:hypothetical protein
MPGDPKECRLHAANCRKLAEAATSPDAKEHFLNLARQWDHLAADLESADIFIRTMVDLQKPSGMALGAKMLLLKSS